MKRINLKQLTRLERYRKEAQRRADKSEALLEVSLQKIKRLLKTSDLDVADKKLDRERPRIEREISKFNRTLKKFKRKHRNAIRKVKKASC